MSFKLHFLFILRQQRFLFIFFNLNFGLEIIYLMVEQNKKHFPFRLKFPQFLRGIFEISIKQRIQFIHKYLLSLNMYDMYHEQIFIPYFINVSYSFFNRDFLPMFLFYFLNGNQEFFRQIQFL